MLRPIAPWRRAIDVASAVLFVGLVVLFALHSGVLLVGALLGAALVFRRWSPPIALALSWAAAVVQLLQRQGPLLVDVAIFAVLFACAAYGGRGVRWAAFVSAAAGAVIAGLFVALVLQPAGSGYRLQSGLVVGGVTLVSLLLSATAGQLLRIRRLAQENRRAAEVASRQASVEQERTRIARDMHDVVGHSLAVVIAQADGATRLRDRDPEAVGEALATISATARAALADVRVLLQQLRFEEMDGPQPLLGDLGELLDGFRASGLDVRRHDDGEPVPLPVPVQIAVFRVVQESLTNALRHGGDTAEVRLAWARGGLEVRIDNPFRPDTARGRPGNGVTGMQERAALAGGHLQAGQQGPRWLVSAWFPASSAADLPARHVGGVA